MRIILTDINILPCFLRRYSKKRSNEICFEYAEKICNKLFGESSLFYLDKLGIDRFETVFTGSSAFYIKGGKKLLKISSLEYRRKLGQFLLVKEILKGKPVYVCRLENEKGFYEFLFPELVLFELSASTSDNYTLKKLRNKLDKSNFKNEKKKPAKINAKKIQAYLVKINLKSLKSQINLAKRDLDFVERFNNEMFHQNISYNNRILARDEVKIFYETERFTKIIDLSDVRERIAFTSLYGIAFKGLELADFYSIDGIFSLQPNRERDILKQLSGDEVFKLILSENRQAVINTVTKMGEALLKLPIPVLRLGDYNLLKQNYSLYCGVSDIGRLFLRFVLPEIGGKLEVYNRAAMRMADFSLVEIYFNFILKCDTDFDLSNNHIYETLTRFETAVKDKKTSAELNHGSKEFKL